MAVPAFNRSPVPTPQKFVPARSELLESLESRLKSAISASTKDAQDFLVGLVRSFVVFELVKRNPKISSEAQIEALLKIKEGTLPKLLSVRKEEAALSRESKSAIRCLICDGLMSPYALPFFVPARDVRDMVTHYNKDHRESAIYAISYVEVSKFIVNILALAKKSAPKLIVEREVITRLSGKAPTETGVAENRVSDILRAMGYGPREPRSAFHAALLAMRVDFMKRFLEEHPSIANLAALASNCIASAGELSKMLEINVKTSATCSGLDQMSAQHLIDQGAATPAEAYWLADLRCRKLLLAALRRTARAPSIEDLAQALVKGNKKPSPSLVHEIEAELRRATQAAKY